MGIPDIREVSYGVSSSHIPIGSIWEGAASGYYLIWEPWFFKDDFNRTVLGPDWVATGGVQLSAGALQKSTSNGSADCWTVKSFPTDDLHVVTIIGTANDANQRSSISLGSPSRYVFCEFSKNGGIIGDYDGQSWNTRASIPSLPIGPSDKIEVRRWGTSISFLYNGTIRATATSTQGRGADHRRVSLSVRRDSNIFGTYYSPTFTDVKVGRHKL